MSIQKYAGFTEHAYRLLFAFEERFPVKPELKTILPSGTVLEQKVLEPEAERAILCFPYAQSIPEERAQPFLETPFVWKREDGTCGLTQTWATRFNRKFKSDFACVKYPQNPDEVHFVPQAVEDFKQTVFKMFGEHEDPPLYLCHKQTQNVTPVYTGTGAEIMDMLRTSEEVRNEFDIVAINEPDGFRCKWVTFKKDEEKDFRMTLNKEYALYTKQGKASIQLRGKLKHQFDSEATLGEEVSFTMEKFDNDANQTQVLASDFKTRTVAAATDPQVHATVGPTNGGTVLLGVSALTNSGMQVVKNPRAQATAAGATVGGVAMGSAGGVIGLATGAVAGGVVGIVPALFTFGLSIPFFAVVGGGTGLCVGTAVGGTTGAVGGGAVGYGAYGKRSDIAEGARKCRTYTTAKLDDVKAFVELKTTAAKGAPAKSIPPEITKQSRLIGA